MFTHHRDRPVPGREEILAKLDFEDDPHRAAIELNPEVPEKLSWSTSLAVLFLCLSFAAPIGTAFLLVTSILVQIGTALGGTTNITWIAGSWSLASSVSFAITGGISDVFGRRNPILAGQLFILVGAIIGASAQNVNSIIAASTIIGAGTGMVFVAYAGIPELLPNKYRGAGLALTEVCISVPWTISVLLANLMYERASWRWIYYISIIYAAISLIGTAIFYYPPARPKGDYDKTRMDEFLELDFLGIILFVGGLTAILIGLTWAGETSHPWNSASVIAPLVVGCVVVVSAFVWDFSMAKNPLFPLHLFKQFNEFTLLLMVVFVAGLVFYSMTALTPQAELYMFENNGIKIGIMSIPAGIGQLIGGVVLPTFIHRIGHIKAQLIVAIFCQCLFTALYSAVVPTSKAAFMVFQFFGSCAFPWITILVYTASGLNVPLRKLGIATGLIGSFRSAGGAVGNAIFGTIQSNLVNRELAPRIEEAALKVAFNVTNLTALVSATSQNAAGVSGAFAAISGITPAVEEAVSHALKEAYAYSFKRVYWSTIPFGVLALIAALFIADPSIYLTNHTATRMEKDVYRPRVLPEANEEVQPSQWGSEDLDKTPQKEKRMSN